MTALLFILPVLGAACDDGGPEPVAGEWELVRVNGEPLPVRVYADFNDTTIYTGGALILDAGHTYQMVIDEDYYTPMNGWLQVHEYWDGEWQRDGDDVVLSFVAGDTIEERLDFANGRLIADRFSESLTFERVEE